MSKHTEGPWFVNRKNNIQVTGNLNVIQTHTNDGLGYHIAYSTGWGDNKETAEEAKCNAYLIAAAPDLLEALESILSDAEKGYAAINPPRMAAAKSAIDKAKGGKT
ncbi:hypothetical protein C5E04_18950 [Pectobacterium parmentieri]|uniref:hypothetical protein n=1 Tax=Pectobacterium TaxID=122277 RepID=UPI000EAD106F|nr:MULTISPECIES: hypothetical protein [Pectobacterium]RKO74397.1 hypothetical protein C5E04_18950 [Pectobacterium parmentieri]